MSYEQICIVCPIGCHLQVNKEGDEIRVTGNRCPRGERYAMQEAICPMRTLATTIRIHNAIHPLIPVITSKPVPKHKLFDIMKAVQALSIEAPIQVGQCLISNIADSGADLLASRTMECVYENQSTCHSGHTRP